MRRISNFLNKNKISESEFANLVTFPFDKLVTKWNSTSSKVFRFMLSPNGNDLNDGLTWATAKRNVQSVLDSLPLDMMNYETHLLFEPGTYAPFETTKYNGTLFIWWLNSSYNTDSGTKAVWMRNGAEINFSNDQLIFDNSTGVKANTIRVLSNKSFNISFNSELAAPTAGWTYCAERIVLRCTAPLQALTSRLMNLENVGLYVHSLLLEMGTCNFACLGGTISRGWVNHLRIVGGTGNATNPNRSYTWQTALGMHVLTEEFYLGNYNLTQSIGWESAFPPTNPVSLDFVGIALLWNSWNTSGRKMFFTPIRGMKFTATATVTNPPDLTILSSGNGLYLAYVPSECNFTDDSTNPHTVKNLTSGIITQFSNSNQKVVNNHAHTLCQTSAPADADLTNQNVALYLDEVTNKLKVKLKYSNGTIKTGEVVLI